MAFAHKNIRLPAQHYRGLRAYFVTICCTDRNPTFANVALAKWLVDWLRRLADLHRFRTHAYCVMPDHLHILLEGAAKESNLLALMKDLKQRTGHEYQQKFFQPLWQKKFYDYVLRPKDSLEAVANYIWLNPVRKGLCGRPEDYPSSGSFTGPWPRGLAQEPAWTPSWKENRPA